MFKKLMRSAGATVLAGGLLASGALVAAPAQAVPTAPAAVAAATTAAKPFTSTKMATGYKAITVSSKGCRYNDFALLGEWNIGEAVSVSAKTDLYRGSKKVTTIKLDNRMSGTAKLCPKSSSQRFGSYSLGGTTISVVVPVRNANNQWDGHTTKTITWRDNRKASFTMKGAIDGSLYGKRYGSKKTFSAKLRYFSDKSQKWVTYNPSGAKLQYKSGSKWKNLKSLKFKSGKASYVQRSSKKYYYRVYVPAKSYAIGGATRGFKL